MVAIAACYVYQKQVRDEFCRETSFLSLADVGMVRLAQHEFEECG